MIATLSVVGSGRDDLVQQAIKVTSLYGVNHVPHMSSCLVIHVDVGELQRLE